MRNYHPSGGAGAICVESLELRRLLSAVPLDGTVPAGNATPFGYSPLQIEQAYGINSIRFGSVVGNGAGQTIAVIAAFDNPGLVDSTDPNFDTSDLHLFDQYFGLPDPPSFVKVAQDGSTDYPPSNSSWSNESAMDVEWAHALAPAANILLVEATNSSLGNLISAGVNYARSVAGVSVVSMSFGSTERAVIVGRNDLRFNFNHAGRTRRHHFRRRHRRQRRSGRISGDLSQCTGRRRTDAHAQQHRRLRQRNRVLRQRRRAQPLRKQAGLSGRRFPHFFHPHDSRCRLQRRS
jgi:hypothetical protein